MRDGLEEFVVIGARSVVAGNEDLRLGICDHDTRRRAEFSGRR
jgi:hypothetical protein